MSRQLYYFTSQFSNTSCTLSVKPDLLPAVRILPLILMLFIGILTSSGQSPSYIHYGVKEGLPSNMVYCATQDHRGFLWFGTDKGLVRFDGTRFQVFGKKDGLPDPEVLNLFEDSQHRLWISCFSQKPCFIQNGRLHTSENDALLSKIKVKVNLCVFSEDTMHRVWIASKLKQVVVVDGDSVQTVEWTGEKEPDATARIAFIDGKIFWLGTTSVKEKEHGIMYSVGYHFKTNAAVDHRILYSMTDKCVLLEWQTDHLVEIAQIPVIGGGVFADRQHRFWLCSGAKGALCFDSPKGDLSDPTPYLADEKVNSVMEDWHGTLWFCTSGHGIYALFPGKAATYSQAHGLVTSNITAIAHNDYGQILAGDDVGNLYKVRAAHIERTDLQPATDYNDRCRQIIALSGDSCWVANDHGLFFVNGKTIKTVLSPRGELGGLKTILNDSSQLWYGNYHSMGFTNSATLQITYVSPYRTTALGMDSDGNIWRGGLDGLYSQRDSFIYNWGDRFPALKSRVIAIQNAGHHKLWVVTTEEGLLLAGVKNGAITSLDPVNGHLLRPIQDIQSLFVDTSSNGRVWLATNKGVYGLHAGDWNLLHFDLHDGLADNDVNCVLVANDTLWAGTVAGLSCFPLQQQNGAKDFSTFITGLHYQSGNQPVFLNLLDSINPNHQIVLPCNAAMITLNLAGLNYRSQGNLLYRCVTTEMLPPVLWWTRGNLYSWIKNRFQSVHDTTIVTESNFSFGISLPSGRYQLQVTAFTAEDLFNHFSDHWTLIMQPYWYSTVWCDLLLWGLVVYGGLRVLRARNAHRKLGAVVSDLQLQTLQSQINPHFVGNSINAIQQFFYPPNPAAASNYVELFTRLLRRTILLSERHFNSFEEELAYDRDYLQMIKLRFGERFEYQILGADRVPHDLPFPSMLLQPILENATIHGLAVEGVSYLKLEFDYSDKNLQCYVIDNGMGYKVSRSRPNSKPVEHKSKGLELLEKKVLAFNKLYDIDLRLVMTDLSELEPTGTGTQVYISFNPEKIKK